MTVSGSSTTCRSNTARSASSIWVRRASPYFFNAGLFNDGSRLRELAHFYARAAMDSGIAFDMVFGSEEFPEWVDQFVDCAIVVVNGVNYALFDHEPLSPLSVIGSNAHTDREYAEVDSLVPRVYLVTRMVMELGRGR